MAFRLLVVDNNPSDRELVKYSLRTLASEGYMLTVSETDNGTAALQMLSQGPKAEGKVAAQPGGIDLVITDVNMIGMSGLEVVAEGKKISPGTRFIVMSDRIDLYAASIDRGIATPVSKSASREEFLLAVRAYLKLA